MKWALCLMALCLTGCTRTPPPTSIPVQLGWQYVKLGNLKMSKQYIDIALKEKSHDPNAWELFGYWSECIHQPKQAYHAYQKAWHYGHGAGRIANNMGVFLCKQGEFDAAERYFQKAFNDQNYLNYQTIFSNGLWCARAAHRPALAARYQFQQEHWLKHT
jgi:type IV pilus assembly protein PilF